MMQMVRRLFFGMAMATLLVMSSCGDDEGAAYPPLLSEFVSILTDGSGLPARLQTDDGNVYAIDNIGEITVEEGLTPDSVYRSIARYERVDGGVRLYALQGVQSSYAVPDSLLADGIKCDPVEMQSVWTGGGYLNMILLVKVQAGKHTFFFVEDSLTQVVGKRNKLYLSLSHDAADDVMAYTRKAYLSVPLFPYSGRLVEGDSVVLSIPTAHGWQSWTREFVLPTH